MMETRSLETELESRSAAGGDGRDFWNRYSTIKSYLVSEYYPWIQANCPFFTDHGTNHIQSVIRSASEMLSGTVENLRNLDLFLLLCAILWHDAAMVHGRPDHAARSGRMIDQIRRLGFPDVTIQKLVTDIAKAHGGKDGLSIPGHVQDYSTKNETYTVKPKALAAVVRFADEISENRTRISISLLEDGAVPADSQIYWEYASCIAASRADPRREFVVVTVEIDRQVALRRHSCPPECDRYAARDGTIAVIQYIISRLEKMNNELAYCGQEFREYCQIRAIELRMKLLDGTSELVGYDENVILAASGLATGRYPKIDVFNAFFEEKPHWNPENIPTGE